jgi:hypothetical protein
MRLRLVLLGCALASGAVAIVGVFSPWATIEPLEFDGIRGDAGKIALATTIAAMLLTIAAVRFGEAWLALLACVPAAGAAAAAAFYANEPDLWVGADVPNVGATGWGSIATAAGASALVLFAALIALSIHGWPRLRRGKTAVPPSRVPAGGTGAVPRSRRRG